MFGISRVMAMAAGAMLVAGIAAAQTPAPTASAPVLPATDVTALDMKKFIDNLPKNEISDLPVRVVDVGSHRVGVYGVFRPKGMPGDAIAHNTKTAEVYVILEGAGVLVTGGQIADPKPPPPGRNPGPRGDKIVGGVSRRVSVGDTIVIPGRTPHWWSSLESDIRYMIVRSDPEGRMNLK
jgi:mannose-6-phosphate isomerase-like protein (cupin superfamily)